MEEESVSFRRSPRYQRGRSQKATLKERKAGREKTSVTNTKGTKGSLEDKLRKIALRKPKKKNEIGWCYYEKEKEEVGWAKDYIDEDWSCEWGHTFRESRCVASRPSHSPSLAMSVTHSARRQISHEPVKWTIRSGRRSNSISIARYAPEARSSSRCEPMNQRSFFSNYAIQKSIRQRI